MGKQDFQSILAEEIRQMSIRIEESRADRDRLQQTPGYTQDKELVRMCVKLTSDIAGMQEARSSMKVALAAYKRFGGAK